MRRNSRAVTLAGSPTLVGAVTVLIALVAVFLAYNANNGLPFVPTYRISVEIPNANTLIKGNEVRIGGVRVGQVTDVEPETGADGSVNAKVDLELDRDQKPLPDDSTVIVRSRSALGLKYLEITRGTATQGLQEGGILPLSAAQPEPVEIDQLFNTFDEPTREAIQVNLLEFGNALAGRGAQLNGAIQELRPLVEVLEPVMRNLASPQTDLRGFVTGLSRAAAEAAPVAEQQADIFVSLDTTFGALATVARPFIQQAIERTPETFDTLARTSPRINRFVDDTAHLFGDLRPGFAALAPTSHVLLKAANKGIPALKASPKLNAQLVPTAQTLLDFSQNTTATTGISQLTTVFNALNPTVSFVAPAQSVCNYGSLLFRNVSSMLSLGDGIGSWQRFISFAPPDGPNNEGSPASAPANGGGTLPGNYLHYNPYPNTAAPGQTHECEAGNETYINGRPVIGNVPGNQGTNTSEQLTTKKTCKSPKKLDKKTKKCVNKNKKKKGKS